MRLLLFIVLVTTLQGAAIGQMPQEIVVWPDGHPEPRVSVDPAESQQKGEDGLTRRFNVSNPRLFIHRPATGIATGAAVIVVPDRKSVV